MMEEFKISGRIGQIIERRKSALPYLEKSGQLLKEIRDEAEERESENDAEALLEECENTIRKFSRDTISIAVIGEAKCGKSEFLRSISGMSRFLDMCALSVEFTVSNGSAPLKAEITFKTESEIVGTVQEYLDNLIDDEAKKIKLYSLRDIAKLDIADIESRMAPGSVHKYQLPDLIRFVDHYDEWAELIGKESVVLTDEREIQSYVCIKNEWSFREERRSFYKYLAVKACNVSCPFSYEDAGAVSFIEIEGFNGCSIDEEKEILNLIKNRSDAVVFLLYPWYLEGGGVPREIAKMYGKIVTECGNKNWDKQLFWLINHSPNHPRGDNIICCECALNTLQMNRWRGDVKKIIDARNQQQAVEEFLIPMLETLTEGVDEADELFLSNLKRRVESVLKEQGKI